jgi:hypothetical protein
VLVALGSSLGASPFTFLAQVAYPARPVVGGSPLAAVVYLYSVRVVAVRPRLIGLYGPVGIRVSASPHVLTSS